MPTTAATQRDPGGHEDGAPEAKGNGRGTSRPRKRLRRLAAIVIIGFAVIGVVAVYRLLAGAPGVGHFRAAEGRGEYLAAYDEAMRALPEPTAVHDVVTSWGTVRAYEWIPEGGEDTVPVVLVPGRSSGVPMWQANLADFNEDRRVLAFDALGDAGLSVQGVPLESFDDTAAWMHEVLTELASGGAHVVGHSMGGAAATSYARQYPEDVVSLSLLDPVFTFAYPPAGMMAWTVIASIPIVPDSLRETALGKVGGGEYDGNDPMARMIAAGAEHFAASLPTPALITDEQAAHLTMPVYVALASDDSLAGGPSAAARARGALADVTVETWPDTTHSLPMQVADPLGDRLNEFWTRSDAGPVDS